MITCLLSKNISQWFSWNASNSWADGLTIESEELQLILHTSDRGTCAQGCRSKAGSTIVTQLKPVLSAQTRMLSGCLDVLSAQTISLSVDIANTLTFSISTTTTYHILRLSIYALSADGKSLSAHMISLRTHLKLLSARSKSSHHSQRNWRAQRPQPWAHAPLRIGISWYIISIAMKRVFCILVYNSHSALKHHLQLIPIR